MRTRTPLWRWLRLGLLAGGLSYAVCLGYLLVRRDHALFERMPASYSESDCRFITGRRGNRIACVYFSRPGARYTLLYSHGSATDLGRVAGILAAHRDAGFNVLAYDYPGIGLSGGSLSETGCHEAIEDVFAWLRGRGVPAADILLYGRSIGSGPTVRLAAREPVAGVILASPFTSAFGHRAWMWLFPMDWFRNREHIGAVRAPVLVLHGMEDATISVENGRMLARLGGAEFHAIAGRGHGDLHEDAAYWRILGDWTARLPATTEPQPGAFKTGN